MLKRLRTIILVATALFLLQGALPVFTPRAHAADTDPGYQKIFDEQICPALKNIKGTSLTKYCKDYITQDGLDNAYHKICGVHGPTGTKKLATECNAYKNYKKGSFTPAVGGGGKTLCDQAPEDCKDPAADPNAKCDNEDCDFIKKFINPGINVLTITFGVLAIISIIIGAINYITSEGDPQKTARAKNRIFNTIIAIVAYMFLYAFLQFLVPGGAFK